MKIIIKKLILTNFKGILSKEIEFPGSANIFGANESGKSTTYTAFNWLLTGKDEFDRADHNIKNTFRKELNCQAHEVEGFLIIDDKEVVLKRVYLEKWTKPKGQSQKKFDGHYTDFYFNHVPCSESEYKVKVEAIMPSNIIKLITNPYYFNSLKWEEQRRGLIAIAGNISDAEIFEAIATPENDYGTLIMVLNSGKSIDEWRKELAAKKLLLKKAAVEYAPRIDEAKRNKPEANDWEELQKNIDEKNIEISAINNLLDNASKALAEKQKGIIANQHLVHKKQTDLSAIRQKLKTEYLAKQNNGAGEIAIVEQDIKTIEKSIEQLNKTISDNATNKAAYQKQINEKDEEVKTLRVDWDKINAETFQFDESKCECPTCKQALPIDNIEAKKKELLENFNKSVLSRKKSKVDQSNQVKSEIKQLQENIAAIDGQSGLMESLDKNQLTLADLKRNLAVLKENESKKVVVDIEAAIDALIKVNTEALDLADEISDLNKKIISETNNIGSSDNESEKAKKEKLELEIKELEKKLSVKETIEKTDKRILQLEAEELANAQAIADLEQQEFETETYTRAQMDILEKRVNGMFKYVKFRLFEKLVNGGIKEACVCEYKEVPYSTLNTAAKLLAGLDVLETLSNYYNIHAPVFCDCRESVTFIPPSKSQIISLFVSPSDKNIRIEAA